jgi:hypothetical protein
MVRLASFVTADDDTQGSTVRLSDLGGTRATYPPTVLVVTFLLGSASTPSRMQGQHQELQETWEAQEARLVRLSTR